MGNSKENQTPTTQHYTAKLKFLQNNLPKMSSSRDMVPMNIRDPFFKDPFFSSTWEEFDKMRQDMISSSKDFWGKVDKDFANFDEQVKKSHADMDRSMAVFRPQLPRWAVSGGADLMPPMTHPTLGRQFSTDGGEGGVMKVKEEKTEDSKDSGAGRAFGSSAVMKQFSRKWTLPKDADPSDVVSNLSSDGVLMVTAPRKNAAIKQDVPIKSIR